MKGCTPLAWPCSGQLISNNPLSAFPADLPFPLPFLFLAFYVIPYSLSQFRTELRHVGGHYPTLPMSQLSEDQTLSFMVASSTIFNLAVILIGEVWVVSHLYFFGFEKHTMKPSPTSWCSSTRKTSPYYFAKRSSIWSDSSGRQ